MREIKLMADYECWPLWWAGSHEPGNVDPGELPISERMRTRLIEWADKHDSTLDDEDPSRSGFANTKDAAAFAAEGEALCAQLRRELSPEFKVRFVRSGADDFP